MAEFFAPKPGFLVSLADGEQVPYGVPEDEPPVDPGGSPRFPSPTRYPSTTDFPRSS